jgi:hypothetical protein
MTGQEEALQPWIEIPDEVDPEHQHTELHVQQMGIDMATEDPWVFVCVKREAPGQHPADVLSIGITDPDTLRTLIEVLQSMEVGRDVEPCHCGGIPCDH